MTFDPSQGDGAQLLDIMQLQATLAGFSLVDPGEAAVTPGSTALTVDVADAPSGVRLGGPAQSFGGESGVALPSADANDPRKALVYLDSVGSVQVAAGQPATAVPSGEVQTRTGVPTVPIPAGGFVPLAEVWIAAGANDIAAGDISSRRMPQFTEWDYNQLENTPQSTQTAHEISGFVDILSSPGFNFRANNTSVYQETVGSVSADAIKITTEGNEGSGGDFSVSVSINGGEVTANTSFNLTERVTKTVNFGLRPVESVSFDLPRSYDVDLDVLELHKPGLTTHSHGVQ
jgi:hypothetical protein